MHREVFVRATSSKHHRILVRVDHAKDPGPDLLPQMLFVRRAQSSRSAAMVAIPDRILITSPPTRYTYCGRACFCF
jgi:hypothetical protein